MCVILEVCVVAIVRDFPRARQVRRTRADTTTKIKKKKNFLFSFFFFLFRNLSYLYLYSIFIISKDYPSKEVNNYKDKILNRLYK